METEKTDKEVLYKGLKILGIALLCIITGPILLTLALGDKENTVFIPLLILASIICITAILLIFKGISTIMDSMFKKHAK